MLRLIDANLDRLSEGLRVLEDTARFILNDGHLAASVKEIRHELIASDSAVFRTRLLAARDCKKLSGNNVRHLFRFR